MYTTVRRYEGVTDPSEVIRQVNVHRRVWKARSANSVKTKFASYVFSEVRL